MGAKTNANFNMLYKEIHALADSFLTFIVLQITQNLLTSILIYFYSNPQMTTTYRKHIVNNDIIVKHIINYV